jgi:PAS domain-containing protein
LSSESSAITLLPYAIAICLVAGLAISIVVRRPPRRLWPVLLLYQCFILLYLVGDAITTVSREMWLEELGIFLIYSGAVPAAAACWVLAIRYAEAQGRPFPWARGWWIRGPVVASAIAWAGAVTNPLHGQLVTPVMGADNLHHWMWYAVTPLGYLLVSGSLGLYALLAHASSDSLVRRNAVLMAGGLGVTLAFSSLAYMPSVSTPFDLTVVGLGAASAIFLYGAYRTQLFSLLPLAVVEATRHDPSGLILVDLQGTWLRSNPAAVKLLGPVLKQPGLDVVSLIARRFRGGDREPLTRDDLARQLLQGPRACQEVVGPLWAGEGHWIEITATPIPRSEGRARAVSLRLQDVSQRLAVEEQLRRARQELQNQAGERRLVDTLLGDVLRDAGRAAAVVDDPEQLRGLLMRVRRAAEQARQLTGAVVPKR